MSEALRAVVEDETVGSLGDLDGLQVGDFGRRAAVVQDRVACLEFAYGGDHPVGFGTGVERRSAFRSQCRRR